VSRAAAAAAAAAALVSLVCGNQGHPVPQQLSAHTVLHITILPSYTTAYHHLAVLVLLAIDTMIPTDFPSTLIVGQLALHQYQFFWSADQDTLW
jgi:hypothetical protein